jgi:hypothetical protein
MCSAEAVEIPRVNSEGRTRGGVGEYKSGTSFVSFPPRSLVLWAREPGANPASAHVLRHLRGTRRNVKPRPLFLRRHPASTPHLRSDFALTTEPLPNPTHFSQGKERWLRPRKMHAGFTALSSPPPVPLHWPGVVLAQHTTYNIHDTATQEDARPSCQLAAGTHVALAGCHALLWTELTEPLGHPETLNTRFR